MTDSKRLIPVSKLRVIVCGGRRYNDYKFLSKKLTLVHMYLAPIVCVIEGDAKGADRLAKRWAQFNNISTLEFPVMAEEWDELGPKAGNLRNTKMLEEGKPNGVIAFPGGKGTINMVKQAYKFKVPVWRPFIDAICPWDLYTMQDIEELVCQK